ncbi:MAG: hypothetical protein IJX13_00395, partial [Clostridia bacterium]|nr:hypothetical protein [Clostridia bacterium]
IQVLYTPRSKAFEEGVRGRNLFSKSSSPVFLLLTNALAFNKKRKSFIFFIKRVAKGKKL